MSIEKILSDEATRVANSLEGGVATLEAELVAVSNAESKQRRSLKRRSWQEPAFSTFDHAWGMVANALVAGFKMKCNLC
jgi:hypothetical protein